MHAIFIRRYFAPDQCLGTKLCIILPLNADLCFYELNLSMRPTGRLVADIKLATSFFIRHHAWRDVSPLFATCSIEVHMVVK